jgi:flavodoxin
MNSVVIFGSRYGNTRKLAETIADVLRKHGAVQLVSAEKAPAVFADSTDLVVIGGPTEAHRMSEPVARFFDRIAKGALAGRAAAGFDTRFRAPAWLSGSAGSGIETRLRQAGARVIAPEVSFFVSGKLPELDSGELERAAAWAVLLAVKAKSQQPVAAGL